MRVACPACHRWLDEGHAKDCPGPPPVTWHHPAEWKSPDDPPPMALIIEALIVVGLFCAGIGTVAAFLWWLASPVPFMELVP